MKIITLQFDLLHYFANIDVSIFQTNKIREKIFLN